MKRPPTPPSGPARWLGSRRLAGLLVVALAGRAAAPVRAEPPASEIVSADRDAALTQQLEAAVAAYEAGDLERARAAFEALHAASPSARTYRSLGLVAFRQGRFEDAVALLDESLASQVKPLGEALRRDAQSLRAEAAAELAAARMESGLGAHVPRGPEAGAPAPLAPADRAELPPPVAVASPSPVRPNAEPSPRGRRVSPLTEVLLATGGVGLLLSAASALTASVRVRRAESDCGERPAGGCEPDEVARLSRDAHLTRLSRLATAGLVLGGTGLALGGATLYLDLRPRRGGVALGVQLSGAF